MEMALAVDPHPGRVPEQLQIGPQTRVFGDGASGSSFWKIIAAPRFYVKRDFIGVGGGRGDAQRAGAGPTRGSRGAPPLPAPGPWVAPQVALWYTCVFRRIKNLRKF